MNKLGLSFLILSVICIKSTYQDVYLHNPRGSNNRLNENSTYNGNNYRVFDSQVKFFPIFSLLLQF